MNTEQKINKYLILSALEQTNYEEIAKNWVSRINN